jgi:hypothetical protein
MADRASDGSLLAAAAQEADVEFLEGGFPPAASNFVLTGTNDRRNAM